MLLGIVLYVPTASMDYVLDFSVLRFVTHFEPDKETINKIKWGNIWNSFIEKCLFVGFLLRQD